MSRRAKRNGSPVIVRSCGLRVEFLVFVDPDLDEAEFEYVPVGSGLERPISMAEANGNGNPDSVAEAFPTMWGRFSKLAETYWHQAELLLRFERGELGDVRRLS